MLVEAGTHLGNTIDDEIKVHVCIEVKLLKVLQCGCFEYVTISSGNVEWQMCLWHHIGSPHVPCCPQAGYYKDPAGDGRIPHHSQYSIYVLHSVYCYCPKYSILTATPPPPPPPILTATPTPTPTSHINCHPHPHPPYYLPPPPPPPILSATPTPTPTPHINCHPHPHPPY